MVYIFDEIEKFSEEEICRFSIFLPESRKNVMERYRFFKDKRLCCIAYLIFLYAVNNEKKINTGYVIQIPFSVSYHGKPFLENYPDMYFNISHCDKAVACGVSTLEIGVDVQDIELNAYADVMRLVFSPEEIADVNSSAFPIKRFLRYWTIKESYYKCVGTGLVDDMNKLDFSSEESEFFSKNSYFFRTGSYGDYQLSVCEKNCREASENIIYMSSDQLKEYLEQLLSTTSQQKYR